MFKTHYQQPLDCSALIDTSGNPQISHCIPSKKNCGKYDFLKNYPTNVSVVTSRNINVIINYRRKRGVVLNISWVFRTCIGIIKNYLLGYHSQVFILNSNTTLWEMGCLQREFLEEKWYEFIRGKSWNIYTIIFFSARPKFSNFVANMIHQWAEYSSEL